MKNIKKIMTAAFAMQLCCMSSAGAVTITGDGAGICFFG